METQMTNMPFGMTISDNVLRIWATEFESVGHKIDSEVYTNPDTDRQVKNLNQAKRWFIIFTSLAKHFPEFLQQQIIIDHVLNTFPIESINQMRWEDACSLVEEFIMTSFIIYDENFFIDMVSRYEDFRWFMKKISPVMKEMPNLAGYIALID